MADRESAAPDRGRSTGWGRLRPGGFVVFLAAVSVLAAATVLLRGGTHGPALHWDGVNYLAVARNLLAGEGFRNFDGTPYALWPPLYPLALAAATLGTFDPLETALPFGALVFGLTVFAAGRFLERRLRSRFLAFAAPAVLALSVPLGDLAWWALSGPLFVLLSTLALIRADAFRAEGRTSALVGAAVLTALAWQTRYLGAAVALAAAVAIYLAPAAGRRRRFGRAALFSVIAAGPTALWLLRTSRAPGGLGAHRQPVDEGLGAVLAEIGSGLLGWAELGRDASSSVPWSGLSAVVLPAVASMFLFRRPSRADAAARERGAAVFGGFALAYGLSLALAVALGFTWHGVQERFLAPLYLPILLAATLALDLRFAREPGETAVPGEPGPGRRRARGAFRAAAALALLAGVAGQAGSVTRAIGEANSEWASAGLAGRPWNASRTARYFRENGLEGLTYSNFPLLLYHYARGRGPYRPLPATAAPPPPSAAETLPGPPSGEPLRRWFENAPEGALVVWVADEASYPYYAYGRPGLLETPGLSPVAEFPDGAVWRVSRRPPADTESAAAASPYRAAHERIASGAAGAPLGSAGFDLYLGEGPPAGAGRGGASLVYLREPCTRQDAEGEFRLRLYAPPGADPSDAARGGGAEFEEWAFRFREYGIVRGGRCIAIVPLPPGAGGGFRTEQRDAAGRLLRTASARTDRERFRQAYRDLASGAFGPPAGRAVFDLYRRGRTLAYLREPCAPEAADERFFLHLYRSSPGSSAPGSPRPGFENRDFDFPQHGAALDGRCLALVELPAGRIRRIRTGQWVSGRGESWSLDIPGAEDSGRAPEAEHEPEAGPPVGAEAGSGPEAARRPGG